MRLDIVCLFGNILDKLASLAVDPTGIVKRLFLSLPILLKLYNCFIKR